MSEVIDVRGLSCPMPAMKVIEVLKQKRPKTCVVLSDDPAACDMITRLVKGLEYTHSIQKSDQETRITLTSQSS